MGASYIFPQGVLVALSLVGAVLVMEELEPEQSEIGLPLCSVAITTLSGVGSIPKLLERKI